MKGNGWIWKTNLILEYQGFYDNYTGHCICYSVKDKEGILIADIEILGEYDINIILTREMELGSSITTEPPYVCTRYDYLINELLEFLNGDFVVQMEKIVNSRTKEQQEKIQHTWEKNIVNRLKNRTKFGDQTFITIKGNSVPNDPGDDYIKGMTFKDLQRARIITYKYLNDKYQEKRLLMIRLKEQNNEKLEEQPYEK